MSRPDPYDRSASADVPPPAPDLDDEPGDPACWAHLVCPECGGIADGSHRPGCSQAPGAGEA